MKLTQELVVTIVFLGGSWVTLSVVAVAFPPATSSIRAAISAGSNTKHVKVTSPLLASNAPVPAEDVLPTEDTTTFLQDEKPNVVQVVTTDTNKDELFILGENDTVPEKLIEDNPNAKMIVVGADETTAKSKLDKFNLAAKNVAIRVALAKQAATRQAQADFAKLRDWRENGSHFALEVKARRFEYNVHDVLKDKLEEVAEMPELIPATANMTPMPVMQNDTSSTTPNQMTMLEDKLSAWRDDALTFATQFSAKEQLHQVIGLLESKPAKTESVPAPQASVPNPNVNSAVTPNAGKADIQSLDLRPLNEKLTLDTKAKPFTLHGPQPLNAGLIAMTAQQDSPAVAAAKPATVATIAKPAPYVMPSFYMPSIDDHFTIDTSVHRYSMQDKAPLNATLAAMNDHATDLPLATAIVYQPAVASVTAMVARQPAKTVVVEASVKTSMTTPPAAALPQAIVALAQAASSYSPVPTEVIKTDEVKKVELKTAEVKADKPLDLNRVHAATSKVLQSTVKVAAKDKSSARAAAQLAAAKALHLKQLAAADAKHKKAIARENAIASLERQLSAEPAVIVVPAKPAQQRVASVERTHAQPARPQYQQTGPRAEQPVAREQQVARRQVVERDPFEEYFEQQEQKNHEMEADRQTTNVASMDMAPSDEEARDISGDMRRPEEYSRLMEE